jgi:hypothetical protein
MFGSFPTTEKFEALMQKIVKEETAIAIAIAPL